MEKSRIRDKHPGSATLVRGMDPDPSIIKQKNIRENLDNFFVGLLKVNDESGSISQIHGSADPDPDLFQNVMNPQHCFKVKL